MIPEVIRAQQRANDKELEADAWKRTAKRHRSHRHQLVRAIRKAVEQLDGEVVPIKNVVELLRDALVLNKDVSL